MTIEDEVRVASPAGELAWSVIGNALRLRRVEP